MRNNKGISLITLVITIVVAIILATIAIQTSSDTPDKANYTKYLQEMKNVQDAVDNAKITNARKGTSEEKLTNGFKKVYLKNAPASFVSFGDIDEEITGYAISLREIDYEDAEFGHAYKTYFDDNSETPPTLTFGKKEDDVFVFDATWQVYYVKGLKYDESMNYTFK